MVQLILTAFCLILSGGVLAQARSLPQTITPLDHTEAKQYEENVVFSQSIIDRIEHWYVFPKKYVKRGNDTAARERCRVEVWVTPTVCVHVTGELASYFVIKKLFNKDEVIFPHTAPLSTKVTGLSDQKLKEAVLGLVGFMYDKAGVYLPSDYQGRSLAGFVAKADILRVARAIMDDIDKPEAIEALVSRVSVGRAWLIAYYARMGNNHALLGRAFMLVPDDVVYKKDLRDFLADNPPPTPGPAPAPGPVGKEGTDPEPAPVPGPPPAPGPVGKEGTTPERAPVPGPVSSFDSAGDCSICFERIESDGDQMACGHVFHAGCINPWLKKNNTCPLCRLELPPLHRPR